MPRNRTFIAAGPCALMLALGAAPDPAHAVCDPASADNVTATCSGVTVNQNGNAGYGGINDDNVTVTVLPGASVTGTNDGIILGTNAAIINSGSISGTVDNGVEVANTITSLTNFGSISGVNAGVVANGITSLTNSGSISAVNSGISALNITSLTNFGSITGQAIDGVQATTITSLSNFGSISGADDGVDATILTSLTNSGSISGADDGVLATDSLTSLTNSGSISGGDHGVRVFNTLTSLINSGSISGVTEEGVRATTITSLTNFGSISGGDAGIQADANLISLTNFGSIRSATDDGVTSDVITSLTNFGLIQGDDAAIHESGAGDTLLTLGPGSILIGELDLGGGVNTLNVLNGLSIANTFDPTGGVDIVNANGAPFAVSGNQVAVADPTNLSVQDEVLTGLTGGIFSTVQNRLNGFGQGGVSGVTGNPRPSYVGGAKSAYSTMIDDPYRQAWAQGFGSYRLQRGQEGPAVDADVRLGGVVSGLDGATGGGGRAGVFFGGAWGDVDADFDSQETDVESVFGGLYGRWLRGNTLVDLALTVGYSEYDRERRVANNTVATGLQTATADYDGWFISPEITFTRPKWVGSQRMEKSLTLRYAGLFLDGFTETGVAAPLTVDDRDIHVLQARTQLTMPVVHEGADGSRRSSAFYVGLEGRANVGDDSVSGALLGQNINFDPGGEDYVAGAFAGLNFERTSAGGTTLYANVEGQFETGGGRQASGKAGVKFRF